MRNETELERWDRNFAELLQELRVAQTGVQILFAFMLTLPFAARFYETTREQRAVYVVTLVFAAIAMAFLIAPVSYHRQVFRQGRKPQLVRTASRMAQAGLVAMLIAVTCAIYLVLDVVAGTGWAAPLTACLAGLYILLWYVLPMFEVRTGPEPIVEETVEFVPDTAPSASEDDTRGRAATTGD